MPALGVSVFVLSGDGTKNGEERVVWRGWVGHRELPGEHPDYVFVCDGNLVDRMNNSAWRRARIKTGLEAMRVHDLRHAFGMRLRAAGVSMEDCQDLLGHKSGWITTHHGAAELGNLLAAVEKIAEPMFQESPNPILIREQGRAARA